MTQAKTTALVLAGTLALALAACSKTSNSDTAAPGMAASPGSGSTGMSSGTTGTGSMPMDAASSAMPDPSASSASGVMNSASTPTP